ncbi:MAG: hypothetical protein SynsKO_14270 [Synoicihabitans sp.]
MNFDEERAFWLLESYVWLNQSLPPMSQRGPDGIIFPHDTRFARRNTFDHTYAVFLFETVQGMMELSEWPCELHPEFDDQKAFIDSAKSTGLLGDSKTAGAAGTFRVEEDNRVIITYSTDKLRDPISLAATFAHELSHYLLATIRDEPPTGWKDLEYLTDLTDLTAIKEGFGIFLSQSCFQFQQWSDALSGGWSQSNQGYLSESEISFALALYSHLHDVEEEKIAANLKPNAKESYYLAMDDLADLPDWIRILKDSPTARASS